MIKLNLLPRKEFEIILEDGTVIKGQFGTWALKRFCDKKKLSLQEVGEKFLNPSIDDAIEYILCAIEYATRKAGVPFAMTDVILCDIIDEMGGMQSENFSNLFNHSGDESAEKKTTTDQPVDSPGTS